MHHIFIVACTCNNPNAVRFYGCQHSTEYIPIPACRLFIWQGNNSMIDCLGRYGSKTHTSKAPLCTQSNGRLLGQHFAGSPVQPVYYFRDEFSNVTELVVMFSFN